MTKPTDPVLKVLRGMRKLLRSPKAWVQGAFALTKRGVPTDTVSSSAACWCLDGARSRAGMHEGYLTRLDARNAILKVARSPSLIEWNDKKGRTHAQVLRLLDRTIARREKEIASC